MKRPEIILVGGGGHCKSCIDVLETEGCFDIKGIIDLPKELGKIILGYNVIGNDDDLPEFAKKGFNFIVTIGHLGNPKRRMELFNIIKTHGGKFPTIISPASQVSKYANIGAGTIIMHNAVVNTNAIIGNNCIINSKALIEHDVIIGDNCHISTDANINGNCIVSDNCFIGSSSSIKNGLKIEKNTIIGMGSVVVKSITESGVFFGNPLRKIV